MWEVLNTESEWIDLETMTGLCFPEHLDCDHESAVVRSFFKDRLYFKFNPDCFFPNSPEQVEHLIELARETEKRNQMIDAGAAWLRQAIAQEPALPEQPELAAILKSYYVFEKDSRHYDLGRAILAKAGLEDKEKIFESLVKAGVWSEDENIDLYRYEIPTDFPQRVKALAEGLGRSSCDFANDPHRRGFNPSAPDDD